MINFKYNYMFVLLVILISFNKFNAYIVKDISPVGTYYKSYLDPSNQCGFGVIILCYPTSQDENCDNLSYTISGPYNAPINKLTLFKGDDGGVSTYLRVDASSIGSYILLINDNSTPIFQIQLECIELDLDTISFETIGDYYVLPTDSSTLSIFGQYKINGIQPDVSFEGQFALDASLASHCSAVSGVFGPTTLLFSCNTLPANYNPSLIQVTLLSGSSSSKIFNLNPLTVFENYQVLDYNILSGAQVQLMGYNRLPLLQFTINSTNINKGYYMLTFLDQPQLFQINPIYSDEKSTTILASLPQISNNAKYNFYYQSNKSIQEVGEFTLNVNQYEFSQSVSISTTYSYQSGLPMVSFGYGDSTTRNDLPSYYISYCNSGSSKTSFPYGFISGNTIIGYEYQVSILTNPSYKDYLNIYFTLEMTANSWSTEVIFNQKNTTFTYDNSLAPRVLSYEIIYLEFGISLLRIGIKSPYGFSHFINSNEQLIGVESLISGDLTNGTFEFLLPDYFYINDKVLSRKGIFYDDIVLFKDQDVIKHNPGSKLIPNFDIFSINSMGFLYNDIDVSNHRFYNILYFNYSDIVPRDIVFSLIPFRSEISINDLKDQFTSSWNDTIKLFQIEFYVEANIGTGEFPFLFYVKSQQKYFFSPSMDVKLRIKSSKMDNQGPIIKDIVKIVPNLIDNKNYKSGILGWSLMIEDKVNGFDYGYFVIKGQVDQSYYNITITSKDINSNGKFDIKLNISHPCISQNYVIDQVKLIDKVGIVSYFSVLGESADVQSIYNPFLYYLNDSSINKINLQCESTITDTTPPVLISFGTSLSSVNKEIDVSKTSRIITFNFGAIDFESGIKNNTYPSVYITNSNNQILECRSRIIQFTNQSASYTCSIELPLGFGYPGIILYSVYGFINNNGLFSGYSTNLLYNNGYESFATTKYLTGEPTITSYLKFTDRSTSIWLLGKSLANTNSVYIKYFDDSTLSLIPSVKYSTAIEISNIKQTNKPFEIYVQTSTLSNTLIITPIVYDYYINIDCNGNGILNNLEDKCICYSKWTTLDLGKQCTTPNHYISSSSQVSSTTGGEIELYGWFGDVHNNPILYINDKQITSIISTSSNLIKVNIGPGQIGQIKINYTQNSLLFNGTIYPYFISEILCYSNCELNGHCDKTNGKCICNSGFTGLDCLSPIVNNSTSNSNSNQTITTETQINNNGTVIIKNSEIEYLILIDSIIEFDINGLAVSVFNLSKNWEFLNKVNNTISTFIQKRTNPDNTVTNIKLIIEEVIEKDKEFSFAGNQFTISKDGLKLSLSISNWLYQSNLNTLQVQMSSDIQIDTKTNKCNQDKSNSLIESSSNNNYLSNNINYLKITKNNRSFYARFQNKMLADNRTATVFVQLLNSNNNKVTVGLNLPKCDECLIDPDFSLLITSNYKFDCNIEKKQNKTILAVAIAVGVGGLVLVLLSLYLVYKKSTALKIKLYKIKKSFSKS